MTKHRSPRVAVFSIVAAIHVGLFVRMAAELAPARAEREAGAVMLSLFDGSALTPAAVPPGRVPVQVAPPAEAPKVEIEPRPTPPPEPVDPVLQKVLDAVGATDPVFDPLTPVSTIASAESAPQAFSVGEACQLTGWVQWTLQNDPDVFQALSAIPRQGRSVANAIMLWDGDWVETDQMSAVSVQLIQRAIILSVRSAPPECLDAPIVGPLFLPVQDAFGTTLVAVGSGFWQWGDMLRPPLEQPRV